MCVSIAARSFLFLLSLKYAVSLDSTECEPTLTKFSYDEQLLQKVIEMGHKMEQLEKGVRKTEEFLLSVLEYRRGEMDKLSEKVRGELGKFAEDMQVLKDQLNSTGVPRVAFSAYSPADKGLQSQEYLVLQSVSLNNGSGYDTTTGLFTAPVAGLYLFTAHVCNTVNYVIHYAITLNDEWIARSQQFEENAVNSAYGSCNSVSALTTMEPGNKVGIFCTSGYSSVQQFMDDTYRRNSFLGVLLQK